MGKEYNAYVREALEKAREAALASYQKYIGTEHLVIGLLSVESCLASRVLAECGLTYENYYKAVLGQSMTLGDVSETSFQGYSPKAGHVLEMAKAYKDPLLPNAYCSTCCPIGKKYVPQLTEKALSQITLEILQSVNALYEEKNQLISITVDGEISENEMEDFARIQGQLKTLSAAADTLQIWLEKRLMG